MNLLGFEVGPERPFFLIAGPCVVESEGLILDTAGKLKEIAQELAVPFIFKSSFDKANRSSRSSFRGPGIEEGLRILSEVKRQLRVPVLTDVLVSPNELHRQCSLTGPSGKHQEGAVPIALGNAERRG
jgi:2-dehydro-3-deoxyphosphooctonate aldolase (KDO 8-P synthase)